MRLPPHCPWDCAIELLPNAMPSKSKIYPLSLPENKAVEDYVKEALATGYIRLSTSPAVVSFFFVEKRDGGLRPCIDYRGLNLYCPVRSVLTWLLWHHLYIKAEKCEFHRDSITFLCYIISQKGMEKYVSKVKAMEDWPEPTTIRELQRFLGVKSQLPHWTTQAQNAFDKLKASFNTALILKHPDPSRPFIVEVDDSSCGIGAVLSQRNGNP
ncbi:hypothetical protein QTP86_016651 [Hemibagrus guttatus]|nr:hypothetical protein QTP86_016651 [Hemibagrus guttatus]